MTMVEFIKSLSSTKNTGKSTVSLNVADILNY